MKFNGPTLFLVVVHLAFVLISSEGRHLLQATTRAQSPIPIAAKALTKDKPKHSSWGGCWRCWKKRRLLTTWSSGQGDRCM
nr:hypothetical protein [Tanacetum cinerariifolium]